MRRLALLLLLCCGLAGCGATDDLADVRARLTDAGYADVTIDRTSADGTDRLDVTASSNDAAKTTEEIAEIVWDSYPRHVDELWVGMNRTVQYYTAHGLREAFGERQVAEESGRSLLAWLGVSAVVVLLLVAGAIVVAVVLARRSHRRRAQQQPYDPTGSPPAA